MGSQSWGERGGCWGDLVQTCRTMSEEASRSHTTTSTPQSRGFQGERLLDEQGWQEEAAGVIKEIADFVKVFKVSEELKASSTEIFFNLITLEDSKFTIRLSERGFELVGDPLDTNSSAGTRVYETPHSLLDNISPGYRQVLLHNLTNQHSRTCLGHHPVRAASPGGQGARTRRQDLEIQRSRNPETKGWARQPTRDR